jgi:hypothetical protein
VSRLSDSHSIGIGNRFTTPKRRSTPVDHQVADIAAVVNVPDWGWLAC